MIGLILAGGNGTRIKADVKLPSKVLIPIADRTLIQRNVDVLSPYVSEIVIIVGKAHNEIKEELLKTDQLKKITFLKQNDATGPLDAMRIAFGYVKDEDVLMALGDEILISGHIGGLIDNAYEKKSDMSFAIIPYSKEEDIAKCYSLYYDKDMYVSKLVEKPTIFPNKDRGAGYYYISKSVFNLLSDEDLKNKKDILDLFNYAISKGFKATSYHIAYQAFNINTMEELNKVKEYFQ